MISPFITRWAAVAAGASLAVTAEFGFAPSATAQGFGGQYVPPPRREQPRFPGAINDPDFDRNTPESIQGSRLVTSFAGKVTGVSGDRVSVMMAPPRFPTFTEQVFKITDETSIVVNGEIGKIGSIHKGDIIRVSTNGAAPETAVRIVAVDAPTAKRDEERGDLPAPTREVPSIPAPVHSDYTPRTGPPPKRAGANTSAFNADTSMPLDNNGKAIDPNAPPGTYTPPNQQPTAGQNGGPAADLTARRIDAALGLLVQDSPGDGVMVMDLREGSPAAMAGLRPGDYLLKMNDNPISDPAGFVKMLKADPVPDGDNANAPTLKPATLTVWRAGKTQTTQVTPNNLVMMELSSAVNSPGNAKNATAGNGQVNAENLPQQAGKPVTMPAANLLSQGPRITTVLLGVDVADGDPSGVKVTNVSPQSHTVFEPGDVILSVDGNPVDNRRDLENELGVLPKDAKVAQIVIRRGDQYSRVDAPVVTPPPLETPNK